MDRQGLKQSSAGGWLLAATAVAVAVGAILVWGFFSGRNEAAVEVEPEQQVKAPLRVSTKNGETLITLDAETQQRNGIETAMLTPTPYQEQARAYGMVLDIARLTALSNNYANAKAQVQTAQAKLGSQDQRSNARRNSTSLSKQSHWPKRSRLKQLSRQTKLAWRRQRRRCER